jgi:TPR repeat protein
MRADSVLSAQGFQRPARQAGWRGVIGGLLAAACLAAQAAVLSPVDQALAKAQESLAAGRYDEAYQQYQGIYKSDQHPLAAFSLGLFYRIGWGRPADQAQACQWFLKAAEGKLPAAEHFAGDCLAQGIGQAADPAKAASWYERAAGHGHTISLCSLAQLYVQGRGVERDPQKGLALCSQAAAQGSVPAMMQMAQMLSDDAAVRDQAAAYGWYEQAAQHGSAEAQYQLGLMSRDGIGHAADAGLARSWFESAALQSYVPAYFPTAQLYFDTPPDPQTGTPAPEILAKDYLWLQVASHCLSDPAQLRQARGMLDQVLTIMPKTWAPSLDEKLKGRLCEPSVADGGKAAS